ncbi:MAG TPA: hypothetical protein PKG49_07630 [Nitrosomonas mobilis]|nr:hypothetical protein [Nitrosomonas mobilis]
MSSFIVDDGAEVVGHHDVEPLPLAFALALMMVAHTFSICH